jgi:ribosomal protein S12 methylthiotransferase
METSAPTVAIVSLGCPKNLVDSERLCALLAEAGCVVGLPMDEAEVILINTCGFLESARQESLEVIEEALACRRQGTARRVVVAGCLVNRDGRGLFGRLAGVDAFLGVHDREHIVEAVTGGGRFQRLSGCGGGIHDDRGRLRLTLEHTAYLRIAEGCSRGCTFCTIPAIRGPYRSKPPGQILEEARELIDSGARELILIAQDTTAYGEDLGGTGALAPLLRSLDGLEGLRWLRLMYAYPRGFDEELIDAMASCPRVVPYLDMPLQHISDAVLRRMGRGVSGGQTRELLDRLFDRIGGLALRTTLISGFPGESEADFRELLELVEQGRFESMGVFCFSAESGTPAARMDEQVPDELAEQRAERLMQAQLEVVRRRNAARLGQRLEILLDGEIDGGETLGRAAHQAPEIDGVSRVRTARTAGSFLTGEVVDFDDYDLIVEEVG